MLEGFFSYPQFFDRRIEELRLPLQGCAAERNVDIKARAQAVPKEEIALGDVHSISDQPLKRLSKTVNKK